MQFPTAPSLDAVVLPARSPIARPHPRLLLAAGTALAIVASGAAAAQMPATTIDPDLVRVIQCMAAIKGGFALMALAACFWRLARPILGWRVLAYVAGPPLMAAGAVALWSLHVLGLAALGLHLGLFGVIAAALTDPAFFDGWRRRRGRAPVSAAAGVWPRPGLCARSGPAAPAAPARERRGPAAER